MDVTDLVTESFRLHLSLHQDAMTAQTYGSVSQRFGDYARQIRAGAFEDFVTCEAIQSLVKEHVDWLTYRHVFTSMEPRPPFQGLDERIDKAEQLCAWLEQTLGPTRTAQRCRSAVSAAKAGRFPFDHRTLDQLQALERGEVVPVHRSVRVPLFRSYETICPRDEGPRRRQVWVRVSQEAPTWLFRAEFVSSGRPRGSTLTVHDEQDRVLAVLREDDRWSWHHPDDAPGFAISRGSSDVTVHAVGTCSAIFVQREPAE